ncbi:unnamed protein product, partial [Mesorhabditis belari]|uniref:Serine/threonine-protein phosphatase 4 regulatory subunit 1 n=1 Tax=Mesorhabditis belari TaxID=2138241 RepID=A0AAF3FEX3_9BILA
MVKNFFVWLTFYLNTIYLGIVSLTLKVLQRPSFASSIFWSMSLQHLQNLSLSPIRRQSIDASFDNGLGILTRFSSQARSSSAPERQDCFRSLIDVIRILNDFGDEEHFEKFFQTICELGEDEALQVRGALLERYPTLFSECRGSSHLNPYVDRCLTPCLTSQLNSVEMIRKAALDVIGILLEQRLFSEESLKNLLVPTLFLTLEAPLETDERVQQSYNLYAEEIPLETCTVICRVISMQCINDQEWIFQNFVPKFSTFLQKHSSAFQLRKAAIQIFGQLADLFGEGFVEAFLVPHLVALSNDDAWGVRKAVCEIFVDVASFSNSRLRKEVLVPVYLRLLNDKIRWVASMAAQELGRFISTFADHAFTGLSVQNGKVVEAPSTNAAVKEEDIRKYAELPAGCYMPENDPNSSSLYQHAESFDDNTLLLFEKLNRRSNFNLSVAALGRCSSSDNLSKVGLESVDLMQNYEEDNLDFDNSDPFNCTMDISFGETSGVLDGTPKANTDKVTLSPASPSSPELLTYWRPTFQLSDDDLLRFGILTPFGSSSSSQQQQGPSRDISAQQLPFQEASFLSNEGSKTPTPDKGMTTGSDLVEMDISNDDMSIDSFANETASTSGHANDTVNTTDLFDQNTSCQEDTSMDFSDSSSTMDYNVSTTSASTFTEMEGSTMVGDLPLHNYPTQNINLLNNTASLFQSNDDMSLESSLKTAAEMEPSAEEQKLKEFIPMELVKWFIREMNDESDADYNKHRAKAFPAVALTLGKRHWEILRKTYLRLVNDNELAVRALLAASLHDIATIVGPDITLNDLVPAFNRFREDEEGVRQNLLFNLFEFVERVPEPGRILLLQSLPHMLRTDNNNNNSNWRFRKDFAIECGKLCSLYSLDDVNRGISGIALTLCSDRVDEVRDEAARLTAGILGMMVQNEIGNNNKSFAETKYTKAFVDDIVRGYAHSRVAKKRITFATICKYLLSQGFIAKEHFIAFLLDPLLELATDDVGNVRYSVCQVLLLLSTLLNITSVANINQILLKLEKDSDGDVSRSARRILAESEQVYAAEMAKPIDVTTRKFQLLEKEEEYFATLAEHMERARRQNFENGPSS